MFPLGFPYPAINIAEKLLAPGAGAMGAPPEGSRAVVRGRWVHTEPLITWKVKAKL